jgi:hypothetical protein
LALRTLRDIIRLRSFPNIARRMLDLPALNRQVVDPTDSGAGVVRTGASA